MLSQNTRTYREANLQSRISFYFLFSSVVRQRTVSPERADWVWVYISEIIKTDIWTRGCLYHSLCLYSHQTCTSSGSNSKLYFRIAQACPLKEKFRMKTGIKPRLKPLIFFFPLLYPSSCPSFPFSLRWVLAKCEGFSHDCGSVLPAGTETQIQARLGQRGGQCHRLPVDGVPHIGKVKKKKTLRLLSA